MTEKPEELKMRSTSNGPNGPSEVHSPSSHQEQFRVYHAFIIRYGLHAAVLLTRIHAWFRSARKKGESWCFQSFPQFEKQIPGLHESALRQQAKKLVQAKAINMRPGTTASDHYRSPEFQMRAEALRLIGENQSDHSVCLVICYGAEDADAHDIESALVLANIEFHKNQNPDLPVGCRLSKMANYLGLDKQTVQRRVRHLLKEKILIEVEVEEPLPNYRYFDFHPDSSRKPVFLPKEESPAAEHYESNVIPATLRDTSPGLEDLDESLSHPPADPQPQENNPALRGDKGFRNIVETNKKNSLDQIAHEASALRSWIGALPPGDLLALGHYSPDAIIALSCSLSLQCRAFQSELGCELAVLALLFRRNPALPASSPEIRRLGYELSLFVRECLDMLRERRTEILDYRRNGRAKDKGIPSEEKVDIVLAAIDLRNHVGVEGPRANGYHCPNPKIIRNCFEHGFQGRAIAEKFFDNHPDATAATVIGLLDKCAKAPPKPTDKFKKDLFHHARAGVQLQYLMSHFNAITLEIN